MNDRIFRISSYIQVMNYIYLCFQLCEKHNISVDIMHGHAKYESVEYFMPRFANIIAKILCGLSKTTISTRPSFIGF